MINQEGWSWTKLGDLISIKHGWPFKSEYMSDYLHGRPIIVSIGNFEYTGGFRFASTTLKAYTGEFPQEFILKPDDILLAMTCQTPKGEILGIPGRIPDDGRIYLHNQRMGKVIIKYKDKVDIDFLYWLFLTREFNHHLVETATGTKILHTAPDRIESFGFLLPPLPEQRRIAEILSTWDRAIDLTAQLIAAKRQYKRGLMQQLLTGKRRFETFVRSKEIQVIEIGSIPSDWSYVSIGDIAEQVSRRNTVGLDLPVLSCTKYDGLVDSLSYFGRQIFSEDTSTYKVVRRHQFAYATNHIEEGSIGYQNLYDEALISPMYTVFQTTSTVDDRFLYALLKTEMYRKIFERSTSASVDRRGSLRWNEFSRIKVPLPTLQEQRAIAEVLNACDQELSLLNRKLGLLKKQKQGLMQQLLTGKVRVKT